MTTKKDKKLKIEAEADQQKEEEPIEAKKTSNGSAKLNLAKMEKSLIKATGEKAAELRKNIEIVKKWQSEFAEGCPQTEGELKKAIKAGDAKKVFERASKLIQMKDDKGIEVQENERKVLDKARKWTQLVVDCETVLKGGKTQTTVDFDRIYDIKSELDRIKCLDEIECIKKIRVEFKKIDEWHEELDKVTEFDQDGKILKVDKNLLVSLIKKGKSTININVSQEIDEIESQVKDNDLWEEQCNSLISGTDYSKIEEAKTLIDTVRNDKEENYNLLDKKLIRALSIWHVKAYCHKCHDKKMIVADFIKGMEKEVKHVTDFMSEIELEKELKLLDMARRYQQTFDPMPKKRAKMIHTSEDGQEPPKPEEEEEEAPPRVITQDDVMLITTDKALPFSVEKKLIDSLKKQMDKYNKEFKPECEKLFKKIPKIDDYDSVMEKMQKELQFISPSEQQITKTKERYQFIIEKAKEYPALKKTGSSEEDEEMDEADQKPRFLTDFQKIKKKYPKLLCQCPEAKRLIEEYEEAKQNFDTLKEQFAEHKLQNTFNLQNLADFNEKLMFLSLDFENEELSFRQDIWHQRISILLKILGDNQVPKDTRVNSEQVRLWLEEGQDLEVVNDMKYEKLNEVVEDIENINRVLRMCNTVQEVDQIDKQENKALLDFTHLINAAKLRISRGDVARRNQQTLTPLEMLKNLRGKSTSDESSKKRSVSTVGSKKRDDDEDASMNPSDEEDDDGGDTDLEEEKADETAVEGSDSKKKKKGSANAGSSKKKAPAAAVPDKTSIIKKPLIMGGANKNKFASKSSTAEEKPAIKKREKKADEKKPAKDEETKDDEKQEEKETKKQPLIKKKVIAKPAAGTLSEESKPAIKGLKMGGGIKKIVSQPVKKQDTPQKPSKKIDEDDEEMAADKEPVIAVSKNEADTADASQEGASANNEESDEPKKPASSLLKKRPIVKSSLQAKPVVTAKPIAGKPVSKKEAAKKEEPAPVAPAKTSALSSSLQKKPLAGILKKPSGGGLAASLAKIKS